MTVSNASNAPTVNRRAAVSAAIAAAGHDHLLVTDLKNVRYLTGFSGSNAALLVPSDPEAESTLVTDGRYDTQVRQETEGDPGIAIRISRDLIGELLEVAGEDATVAVEQIGRAHV